MATLQFRSVFVLVAAIALSQSGCGGGKDEQSGGPIRIEFLKTEPREALALRIKPCSYKELNKFKADKGRVVIFDLLIRRNGKPHSHLSLLHI